VGGPEKEEGENWEGPLSVCGVNGIHRQGLPLQGKRVGRGTYGEGKQLKGNRGPRGKIVRVNQKRPRSIN